MADLLGVVKQMMQPDRHTDAIRVLGRLTAFFRDRDNEFLLTRFACYEAIGVAIGEAGNVKAADHLIEDILYWKFQYPDIRGATDEWETVVNPYHLPKIRCWMRIIESNPALFERLAAALNVQLKLGGVFIADTDLFQRDVTRFLNADIRPIYFVAKQLLRTLPVYFNEVGAEGELRAVSTQIDEICNRRDTLMHFLRKQVHAESSNRLIAFSRAVLRYWLTMDTECLEPYVSSNTLAAVRAEREWAEGPHEALAGLAAGIEGGSDEALDELLALAPDELRARLGLGADGDGRDRTPAAVARRRVALLMRTHQLLARKYSLSADDIGTAVARDLKLDGRVRHRFEAALARWQARPGRPHAGRAARRLPHAARGAQGDHPQPGGGLSHREHLPEAAHRRRHPVDLRQLQRAEVRRARPLVPRREPGRAAARRRRRRGHRVVRDARVPAPHAGGPAPLRARARRRRRRLARPRRQPRHARGQLRAAQLHLPPVPERVPVPRQQRHRAVVDLGPQPRAGAARRPRQRPAAVRGARPVRGRRRRAGAARGARLRRRPAGPRPLHVGGPAPDLDAQRPPRQPRAHAHDELRPGAAGLAHPQAQARHRRPDDARVQGARPQADDGLRAPRARGLRAQHRALRRHAGDVVPAALRRHHPPRARGRRRARAADRPAPRRPAQAAAALHPLRRGDLHAGPHDDVRQRRPQRRARRGVRRGGRRRRGPPGTATAASCSRGPCPTASTATSSTPS